jgi:hypothetical protein
MIHLKSGLIREMIFDGSGHIREGLLLSALNSKQG